MGNAVVNQGGGGGGATDGRRARPPEIGSVEHDGDWFRATRVPLESGGDVQWGRSPNPVVAVQVSAGSVELLGRNPAVTSSIGEWILLEPGETGRFRNAGRGPVTMVMVEVR